MKKAERQKAQEKINEIVLRLEGVQAKSYSNYYYTFTPCDDVYIDTARFDSGLWSIYNSWSGYKAEADEYIDNIIRAFYYLGFSTTAQNYRGGSCSYSRSVELSNDETGETVRLYFTKSNNYICFC